MGAPLRESPEPAGASLGAAVGDRGPGEQEGGDSPQGFGGAEAGRA